MSMRKRPRTFTVTIVETTGARYYELHYSVPQLIRYAVFIVILLLATSLFTIDRLHDRVQSLKAKKKEAYAQLTEAVVEKGNLNKDFTEKLAEIQVVDDRIAFIEGLMGLDSPSDMSLSERMELASERFREKEQEFKNIGDKIENLEDLIGVDKEGQENKPLLERVDMATVNASLKKFMLDSIPNGYPIKSKGISGKFGQRNHPLLHKKEFHPGIDMRAPSGTPVYATADGVVEYAGNNKGSGYGNLVILRHNYGFRTAFAHLEKYSVSEGDFVRKGDVVALSGNTGLSTGPHLHYEVYFVDNLLNPEFFVDWDMENYETIFEKEKTVKWQSLINLINLRLTLPTPQSLQMAQQSSAK